MARKPPYKKHDWGKYRNEYVYNGLSQPDIVKKYGVSSSQIGKIAKKENWLELREAKKREIAEAIEKKATESEIERRKLVNESHLELYNEALDIARSLLEDYREYQRRVKAGELKKSLSPFNLERIFACIEKGQKGQRLALGMNKDTKEETGNKEPEIHYIANLDLDKV